MSRRNWAEGKWNDFVTLRKLLLLFSSRVTGLGEFSPNGRLFAFGQFFFKIAKAAQIFPPLLS
jgi:hypothetical protein